MFVLFLVTFTAYSVYILISILTSRMKTGHLRYVKFFGEFFQKVLQKVSPNGYTDYRRSFRLCKYMKIKYQSLVNRVSRIIKL